MLICDFPDDTSPEEVVAYFERIAPAGFVSARLRKDRHIAGVETRSQFGWTSAEPQIMMMTMMMTTMTLSKRE